jgi:broad specificity phosphatase PhoE
VDCPVDPNLTGKGQNDAQCAGQTLKERLNKRSVGAVSSPMRRTLETCRIADKELSVAFRSCVVLDDARERFGLHICDTLRVYDRKFDFPFADWSKSAPVDQDPARQMSDREKYEDLLARGMRLLTSLRNLHEQEIVVFSHSSFLLSLFNGVLQCDAEELRLPFITGEVRSIVLSFE